MTSADSCHLFAMVAFFVFLLCLFFCGGGRQKMRRHPPASPFLFPCTFFVFLTYVSAVLLPVPLLCLLRTSRNRRGVFSVTPNTGRTQLDVFVELIGTPGVRLLGVNRELLRVRPHICTYIGIAAAGIYDFSWRFFVVI